LLERTTSQELSELRAYETVNGPIGPQYVESVLAAIQEQLQEVCRLLIAQGVEDEDDVPDLHHYPRPYELYNLEEPDGS
jgi:hypothetical protein